MTMRLVHTALVIGGATALLSCFSERQDVTAPPASGECRVDIGGGAIGTTIVAIRDFAFHPATLTVPRGTKVTWVNCEPPDTPSHTSEADAGAWGSPLLPSGATFTHTFDEAGTFDYHCGPHPFMTATVVVE